MKNKYNILEKNKNYYQKNKEKVLLYKKNYYEENKDIILENKKEYYDTHTHTQNNKGKISINKSYYFKNRLNNDTLFRLKYKIKRVL